MKWLIVGGGIQGKKRKAILGDKCVGILDPFSDNSEFKTLNDIESKFDVVAICTPQDEKFFYLNHFLNLGIPCLIEKPFPFISDSQFLKLQSICELQNTPIYTAFNHRFEESIIQLRQIIKNEIIGKPYLIQMRYGNGTVKDIINTPWKNNKSGLLFDLGSHLIDIFNFVFDSFLEDLKIEKVLNSESEFADYIRLSSGTLVADLGYVFWKSDFRFEVWGTLGSVHAIGLKKWGDSKLIVRKREFPSGKPQEQIIEFSGVDTTWATEHKYFENMIKTKDYILNSYVQNLNNLLLGLAGEL